MATAILSLRVSSAPLTRQRLREVVSYDPDTGEFTWLLRTARRTQPGMRAGCTRSDQYVTLKIDAKRYLAHRLAWLYVHGQWPTGDLDHVDRNPSNNRISNLRDVSRSVNMQNIGKARVNNVAGLLGVSKDNRKPWFYARITVAGKMKNLGCFRTAEEAHAAYVDAKRMLHEGCTI